MPPQRAEQGVERRVACAAGRVRRNERVALAWRTALDRRAAIVLGEGGGAAMGKDGSSLRSLKVDEAVTPRSATFDPCKSPRIASMCG